MENPKDKAIDLINKFPIYDWDENKGYVQNMPETKKTCIKVVEEIIEVAEVEYYAQERKYWTEVIKEIYNY